MTETDLYQPVSDLQLNQLKVQWVPRDSVIPNNYNPNHMTWHDRQLLKQSLLEDGWTQPIVTLPVKTAADGSQTYTIVDGEQRWTTSGIQCTADEVQALIDKMEARKAAGHPESESILGRLRESKRRLELAAEKGIALNIAAITGGLVPITTLDLGDEAHRIISTIRHNRARGSHQIDAMAGLTEDLVQLGLDFDDLESRLGMDDEEIRRFLQSAEGQLKDLEVQLSPDFSPAQEVVNVADITDEKVIKDNFQRSAGADQEAREYQLKLAERQRELDRLRTEKVDQLKEQRGGKPVTQDEVAKIEKQIETTIPVPPKPAPPALKKFYALVTPDEMYIIKKVFGDAWASGLVLLCQMVQADESFFARYRRELVALDPSARNTEDIEDDEDSE